MKAVIATCHAPKPGMFNEYIQNLKNSAAEGNLKVSGYVIVEGPGCCNHGVFLDGPDKECETLLNHLCIVLNGKWSVTQDDDPAVVEGQFGDLR
jgi:hypothetical protein